MAQSMLLKICLAASGSKESAWPHLFVSWRQRWAAKGVEFRNFGLKDLELKDNHLEIIGFLISYVI